MVEVSHPTVFDSEQQHVGATYAKALLGASEKAGNSEAVVAELDSLVRDVFDRLPKFEQALASPRIPYERKEQMLDRALRGRMAPLLLNFLKVITRRGRFGALRAIRQATRAELNRLRGRIEVQVQTAEPLDEAAQSLVARRLSVALGGQVVLHVQVVPQIVAGLVIRVGDTVYDGSVANRLARLGDAVASRAVQKMRWDLERFATSG